MNVDNRPRLASADAIVIKEADARIRSYIVELSDGQDATAFYADLAAYHIVVTPRYNLTYALFTGCSFDLQETASANVQSTINNIATLPTVKQIWPSVRPTTDNPSGGNTRRKRASSVANAAPKTTSLPQARQAANDTWATHVMAQVDRLRAQGITGKGVKVGLVDSGVDFKHPALGGCFGPGCLISYGRDFYENKTEPYDNCNGHGTHVAGILAAQSNNPYRLTGVAPGVTVGMYRVTGCTQSVDLDLAIMGINQAYEDGSDIISISSGFGARWSEDPIAVVMERIVDKGVICVAATGNVGRQGLFPTTDGSPAVGRGVAAIASVVNTVVPQNLTVSAYTVGSADNATTEDFAWQVGYRNSSIPWVGTYQVYATSRDSNVTDDACAPLPADTPDLGNYVVLVRLGTACRYEDQSQNLGAKNAQRIMFYGPSEITRGTDLFPVQAVAGVTPQSQGEEWIDIMKSGHDVFLHFPATVDSNTANRTLIFSPNPLTGGYVSPNSAWGLPFELDVKPTFSAPGANILSTWPLDLGGYSVQSGTSMATPFAAGVYALLIEARKTKDPATLQRILSSVAKPNLFNDGRTATSNRLAPVAQQGAGLIQAFDAATVTTLLGIGSISFNDTDHFVSEVSISITNTGSADQTYQLGYVNTLTMYTFEDTTDWFLAGFPNPVAEGYASLTFPVPTVTVPAGASLNVTVRASPPAGLDSGRLPVYGGYITLNSTSGENLSIPYAGVAGSMYDTPIVNPSPRGTYLERDIHNDIPPGVPANSTFTVPVPSSPTPPEEIPPGVTIPGIHVGTTLGTEMVRLLVVPLEINGTLPTTDILGYKAAGELPFSTGYIDGRVDVDVGFTGMLPDGTIIPEGRYEFRILALRIFGRRDKVKDYQSLGYPFNIRYITKGTA
ncbi:peptidase S8/S53 domain-containing protein [Coniochaeta sp. 2T2.1]|nr:peptidase S8/S53 domain-containing protein [Coniochaeta sp. 2T2.1]